MGGIPWAPPYMRPPEEDRIAQLLMHRGRAQAQGTAAQGQIIGGALAGLGQIAAGAVEQRQASKRDTAVTQAIQSWDGQDDMALAKTLMGIMGPDGLKAAQMVVAFRKPGPTLEDDLKSMGLVLKLQEGQPDEEVAQGYPAFMQRFGPTLQKIGGTLPEQFNPEVRARLEGLGKTIRGEKSEAYTLGPNEKRMEGGKEIASNPIAPKPEKPQKYKVTVPGPNGQPMAKLATEEEMAAGIQEYREPRQPRDERLVQVMGPDGVPIWVNESEARGKPAAQAPRAVTGQERQSLAYYNRARKAFEDADAVADKLGNSYQLQYAPNIAQTKEQQAYRQAQRAFTEARLRKESGAAIPTHEYENDARTYFAVPGDTPEVLAQKKAAREEVLAGMGFSAGKAYDEFYGEPFGTPRNKAAGTGPKRIKNDAEYEALPSGAEFIGPDGKRRRKP